MYFIDIHTHKITEEESCIGILNVYPEESEKLDMCTFASVGLHPWFIKEEFKSLLAKVENLAARESVLAIGEAGLDKSIETDFALQKEVFVLQAEMAYRLSKPMLIHAVRSYYDIVALRKKFKAAPPWIIHGFTGNEKTAIDLIKHNFYLSFGEALFKEGSRASLVLDKVPLTHIFFETDDSDLPISSIYERASEILNIEIHSLKALIAQNFRNLFKI